MNKLLKNKVFIEQLFLIVSLVITTLAFGFYYLLFNKIAIKQDLALLLQYGIESIKSESLFFSSSLIIGFLKQYPFYGFGFLICCVIFAFYFKNHLSWRFFKTSHVMRLFLVFTAFIFVYNNTFSSYNYFTDQWYLLERILLFVSAILVYYSPMALLVFIPVLFLSFASFNFPFDSFSITDKMLPFNTLLYSLCSSLLYLIAYKRLKFIEYEKLWITGCLIIVCCSYLSPALMKIRIAPHYFDWFLIEDFTLAFRKYLNRGWLIGINPSIIDSIKELLIQFQKPFLLIALIIELSGLFLFFNWRYSIKILILFIVLNFGIFLLSAIFFWKWIIFNVLMMAYLYWKKPEFNLSYKWSLVVICLFFSTFSPLFPKLGWYSLPYKLKYKINAVDLNGVEKSIQGKDMAPFDIFFTFSRWDVFNKKQLNGSTLDASQVILTKDMTIDQIKEYQSEKGIIKYNENAMWSLEIFLKEYFKNYNSSLKSPHLFIKPKSHIQTQQSPSFLFDQRIKSVKIIVEESWFSSNNQENKEHLIKVIEF